VKVTFGRASLPVVLAAATLTGVAALLPAPNAFAAASASVAQGVPSLAPMLQEVMPAVVNIAVTSKVEIQNPLLQDPFFRRFFDIPDQPQERESQATGSGVIVDAKNGYVITNNHVVDQADTIRVRLSDDREFDATLVGKDPQTDVAVLKIEADKLHALELADSDALQVGDFVVAIGSPFGLRQTVTSGIVSGLSRFTGISQGGYEDFIQTDASINPGNSGGALVDLNGRLVGVPSNILSRSGGSMGIGFAIPANLVKTVMAQLVEFGEVERGRVGIQGQDLTPELAKAFGIDEGHGALVAQVLPDSPAEKAGIKTQDIILEANGKKLTGGFGQLRNMIGLMRIGEKVELLVMRDGKKKKITVEVGKAEDEQTSASENLHPGFQGAVFGPLEDGSDETGVRIMSIEPGSPAARYGFREGDIILGINRQAIKDMSAFREMAQPNGGELLVHMRRGNSALFVVIR